MLKCDICGREESAPFDAGDACYSGCGVFWNVYQSIDYGFSADIDSSRCMLCKGTGTVDVIPRGGGANDAIADECPHCLRRELLRFSK